VVSLQIIVPVSLQASIIDQTMLEVQTVFQDTIYPVQPLLVLPLLLVPVLLGCAVEVVTR